MHSLDDEVMGELLEGEFKDVVLMIRNRIRKRQIREHQIRKQQKNERARLEDLNARLDKIVERMNRRKD